MNAKTTTTRTRTATKRTPAKRTSPAEATPAKTTAKATAVKKALAKHLAPVAATPKRDNMARLAAPVPADATELASHIATARYMIRRATKAGNAELLALAERRLAQLVKAKAVRNK